MRFLIALAFVAPLFAQPCTYVVNPASFSISAASTPGSVLVTQTPGSACGNYSATTQTPWLHITSDVSGAPGSSVTFIADANLSAIPRIGALSIALQTVTVTQAGANCAFSMTPTSQNIPVGGGDNTFKVQANCLWQATSNVTWIAVSASGISDVPVNYTVLPNKCAAGRSGTITLQTNLPKPPTLAVTQDGSPNNISLSAYSAPVASAAANGRIDRKSTR